MIPLELTAKIAFNHTLANVCLAGVIVAATMLVKWIIVYHQSK